MKKEKASDELLCVCVARGLYEVPGPVHLKQVQMQASEVQACFDCSRWSLGSTPFSDVEQRRGHWELTVMHTGSVKLVFCACDPEICHAKNVRRSKQEVWSATQMLYIDFLLEQNETL